MKHQLDLITLHVSPEEARKIATSLAVRSQHFADEDLPLLASEYQILRQKVDSQRSLQRIGVETNHAHTQI